MKLIYFLPLIIFSCFTKKEKKEEIKFKELNPIHIDTTQKKFPILVTDVYLNTDNRIKQKYVVCTENGVIFYTNSKTEIGDTAFYDNEINNLIN